MFNRMMIVLTLALGLAGGAHAQAVTTAGGSDPVATIVKVAPTWSDEFTSGLAAGEWDRGLSPWPETIANRILPGTGERQIYVDQKYLGTETLSTADKWSTGGTAIFMTRRMDGGTRARIEKRIEVEKPGDWYKTAIRKADWMGAVIKSRRSWLYGYFEASIRWDLQPEGWPAFWMLPAKWAGAPEADITEMRIENGVAMSVSGIHTTVAGYKGKGCRTPIPNKGLGFHLYGMRWTPATVTYYIDRKAVCVMATPADMHQPMYMIFNSAIAGWGKAPTAATRDPQIMQLDYVRYWAAR